MKKIFLFFTLPALLIQTCFSDDAYEEKYAEIVNQIQESRPGLENKKLDYVPTPFSGEISANSGQPMPALDSNLTTGPVYELHAIFNAKAKINEAWYNIGDKIDDYTLVAVSRDEATLKSNSNILKLSLIKGQSNVSISWK